MRDYSTKKVLTAEKYIEIFQESGGECVLEISGTQYFVLRDMTRARRKTDDLYLLLAYVMDSAHFITREEVERLEKYAEVYPRANITVGNCYFNGWGVERDLARAMELYQKEAARGSGIALFNIGTLYYYDGYPEKNYTLAFDFFKRSAETGYGRGLQYLGKCYNFGHGCRCDLDLAVKYYEAAMQTFVYESAEELGDIYYEREDYQNAVRVYLLDKGKRALLRLGYCFENGLGTEQDLKRAMEAYKKAAGLWYTEAYYDFARCLYFNIGEPIFRGDAYWYYTEAAKRGERDAIFMSGYMKLHGRYTKANPKIAFKNFKRAARYPEPKALFWLSKCYREGIGTDVDPELADKYLKMSRELGYSSDEAPTPREKDAPIKKP